MRTLISILLFGLLSGICFAQSGEEISEKRNVYNTKGNYHLERNEFKKAIVYYNMAYRMDASDYFSILQKAEAYTQLKMYRQAEECYRIVFETNKRLNNAYRLKYALVLLENDKIEAFKHWLDSYNEVVEDEVESENYLISNEKRLQLYKDTAIVIVNKNNVADTIDFKIKYAGYKPRIRTSPEDEQISLLVSNGDEYHIAANSNGNYEFSFLPMENYRIIIQKENIDAENILNDDAVPAVKRQKDFLDPAPLQEAEIIVPHGMIYEFSVGKNPISSLYKQSIEEKAQEYQEPGENAIDLTILAKELQLNEGEIYTIRFKKDDSKYETYKRMEISSLSMNDRSESIYGQSFFMVLPLNAESNFNVQTDLEEFEKNFSPKKYAVHVDADPIFTEEENKQEFLISLTINTSSAKEVQDGNRYTAEEISIIPGTEYILTLGKPDPRTGRLREIIVPLTRGVKYNLSSRPQSAVQYNEALLSYLSGREKLEPADDEEVIDISVLSKELEVKPGEDLNFSLIPARVVGTQTSTTVPIKSSLKLDGKEIEISSDQNYAINVPFNVARKVNFQTDIAFMQENFNSDAHTIRLDTVSFTAEISVDTSGYGNVKSSGWLSMSVNTLSIEEVLRQNQFMAQEVSIIPGKEYILTVSKLDAETGEEDEIIIPLIRQVKYDFTTNPKSEEVYKASLEDFLAEREDLETIDGTVIDIKLLSKELQIEEGDKVSFSLLPVKKLSKKEVSEDKTKSSLFLDDKVVEFTQIQKYTINMPLSDDRQMNMQTNIQHLQEYFDPSSFTVDLDTASFFSEITIDTSGLGSRVIAEEVITDPVFDVITVNFDLNQSALRPEAKQTIQKDVIDELTTDSRLYVTIKGYTDALGDANYNLNLSKKRAESVQQFLENNGIGQSRIRTFSFGESQSLESGVNWEDLDEAELKKHRKVEIVIYLPE